MYQYSSYDNFVSFSLTSLDQVEYGPCLVPAECWGLMREFMQGFLGTVSDTPNNHFKSKMDGVYMPTDTVQQYLEYFTNFRKSVSQVAPR